MTRYLGIAGFALLASCGSSLPSEGVTVHVSTAQQSIPQEGSAEMTVTVTNGSPRAVSILVMDCPFYVLRNSKGQEVGPMGWICPAMAPAPIRVEAGESYSRKGRWSASGFVAPGVHGAQPPLPPGRYRLSAQVAVERDVRIATNTVEITLAND